jgi:ribosome-associated protein
MLQISPDIFIKDRELHFSAMRAQGAGGQNVNKVSSAVHLRFDIRKSSLPVIYKNRLLSLQDARITREGVIIIKAQESRSQAKNKQIALDRLTNLIQSVLNRPKKRVATKIKRSTQLKRQQQRRRHAMKKSLRSPVRNLNDD